MLAAHLTTLLSPSTAPSLDLNFADGPFDGRIAFSRGSGATAYDATGTLQTAANNAPRFDYGPTPGGTTNWISNSTMQGAVVGSPGTRPTSWGIFAASGLVTSVVGQGTDAATGLKYVDLRFNGTTTAPYYVEVFDQIISVASGQTCTQSLYLALVGGSLANITGIILDTRYDKGAVGGSNIAPSLTSTLTRFSSTTTAVAGSTAMHPGYDINFASGAAVDVTLRFAAPQFEINSSSASPFVPTSGTPANVGAIPIGLLIEEQRTNAIRNNTMQGAVVSGTMSPPAAPTLASTAGGTLAATTYFVKVTYVDGAGGETLVSAESSSAVAASSVLSVTSPAALPNAVSYRVYASTTTGTETLQATVAIGTNWTEPTSGLVAGAAARTTATAKTPGTLPTNWNFPPANGLSTFVIGSGSESGVPYVDIQFAGTTSGQSWLWFELRQQIAASSGQSWSSSFYCKFLTGSLSGVSFRNEINWIDSASRTISAGDSAITPTTAGLATQRSTTSPTAAPANTAYTANFLNFLFNGTAVNFTLRIGAPQLELGAFATSAILTSGSAGTRAGDVATMPISSWINPTQGTLVFDAEIPTVGVLNGALGALSTAAGVSNNSIDLQNQGGGGNISILLGVNGVNQNIGGSLGLISNGVPFKAGAAYTISGSSISFIQSTNGTTASPTGAAPVGIGVGGILSLGSGKNSPTNGYIRRVRYWPRALANSELIQVTT